MSWFAALWLCLRKDLLEVVRDRRALLMQLAVPALVGPIAMLAMAGIGSQVERGGSLPVRIGYSGDGLTELITARGASAAALAQWPLSASAMSLAVLRSQSLPAMLVADSASASVWLDGAHPQAMAARTAAMGSADDWREARRDALLRGAGVSSTLAQMPVKVADLAPRTESLRSHLGWPLLLLLALVAAAAAATVAADLVAGGRERGTRDWAWALPLPRSAQVGATAAAVSLAAATAALVNLASLAASMAFLGGKLAGGDPLSGALALFLPGLVAVIPLAAAVGCWATAMAHGATSAREAQSTLAPLVVGVLALGLVGCLPALNPSLLWDAVPITGLILALRDAMQGGQPWLHLGLAVLSTLACAALGGALAVRLAVRDVTTGGPPAPDLLSAGLVFLAAVAGFLASAVSLAGAPAWLAVPGPLLVLGGIPLLIARFWAWDLGATFGLRPIAGTTAAAAAGLGLVAITISAMAGAAQTTFLPVGEEMAEVETSIRTLLNGITAAGGLPLLLFAVAVVPGVCEELLCRGLLLQAIRRRLGDRTAVYLSALVFAGLHFSPYRFLPQFVLGLLLGLLTLRTGSVLPAMIVHAVHNGIAVLGASLAPET